MDITTIGFDLAKTVFQVHGADGEGRAVLRRKLRRGKVLAFFAGLPSCLVGMEACASAHYWAREIQALGHEVRLIPPQYVRPFVKTNKNDAADAEAICEAVTRPTMRFAPAKSAEQQSVLMLHRARELLVRQRTMVINALRGHCAELGLIVAQGASKVEELVAIIEDPGDVRLPPLARKALGSLVEQLHSAQARIKQLEATLLAWHRSNQASRRLATIPGVGVITATALVATIGDGAQFRSGRQLSAWLGLVPRQHSSGGKDRLGRISKRGDGYIRRLLVHGARSVLRWRRAKPGTGPGWTDRLLARRPTNVVLVERIYRPTPADQLANCGQRRFDGEKQPALAWATRLRYERIYRPSPCLTSWLNKRIQTCEGNDDLRYAETVAALVPGDVVCDESEARRQCAWGSTNTRPGRKQGSTRDRPNPRHCQSFELVNLTGRRSLGLSSSSSGSRPP